MTDAYGRLRQLMVGKAVEATMEEFGIRPFSIVGGRRVAAIVEAVVAATLQVMHRLPDYPGVIGRQTLRFTAQDWALDFDEESGEEAWWIQLQLLDPEQRAASIVDHLAEVSLSDIEAIALRDALDQIITEGRRRFS